MHWTVRCYSHIRAETLTTKNVFRRTTVQASWNVMAHPYEQDFVFRRNGRVNLNRFIRLLAAEVCASAVVMLDTPCSEVVWRVLATHSIRQFLLHFPSRTSPCAITFQQESTSVCIHHKMDKQLSNYTRMIPVAVRCKTYCRFAAVWLLGQRVRIPLRAWIFVSCVGCVLNR